MLAILGKLSVSATLNQDGNSFVGFESQSIIGASVKKCRPGCQSVTVPSVGRSVAVLAGVGGALPCPGYGSGSGTAVYGSVISWTSWSPAR